MSTRSGLGLVELTILRALEELGAATGGRYVHSSEVLGVVERATGLAPGYSYPVLCDLARSWVSPIPLIAFHGDLGEPDPQFEASAPRYTESRLGPAGEIVLNAENGELAPVPAGLINGNLHAGGTRPPFEPRRVLDAIASLARDPSISDRTLQDSVGSPSFPVGCSVEGDLGALFAGRPCSLRLRARIEIKEATRTIVIDHIPPGAGVATAAHALNQRADQHRRLEQLQQQHHELRHRFDELQSRAALRIKEISIDHDGERVVCQPEPGVDLQAFAEQLRGVYPIETTVDACLPASLPSLLRDWVTAHGSEDIENSFAALAAALEPNAAP